MAPRRFPLIVETLARLRSRSCIIDGEAVACDDDARLRLLDLRGPKKLCNFPQPRRLTPALYNSGNSYLSLSPKFGASTGQRLADPSGNVRLWNYWHPSSGIWNWLTHWRLGLHRKWNSFIRSFCATKPMPSLHGKYGLTTTTE